MASNEQKRPKTRRGRALAATQLLVAVLVDSISLSNGFSPQCLPIRRHIDLYSVSLNSRRLWYRGLRMIDGGDDTTASDTANAKEQSEQTPVEGFGVGEKTLELRDLVEVDSEIDVSVPEQDFVVAKPEPTHAVMPVDQETTPIVPTLRPMTVLKFVAPTLALWIAPPIMSLIDTSVVGRYCGANDLAALSPGCTLIDSSSYLFFFIATAATNMVASSATTTTTSNNDTNSTDLIVSEALFLALVSGVFLALLVFLAGEPLLHAIAGARSASVVPSALKYATVRAFGQPAVIMASVARAASLAQKDTTSPLISVALAFLLNAVGTTVLVKCTGMGIVGAAIATLCADCVATLYLLRRIRMSRKKNEVNVEREPLNGASVEASTVVMTEEHSSSNRTPLIAIPTWKSFRLFSRYALPIFFTILGKSVVYNGVSTSVGRLGAVSLAAHQVLLRSFFFWTPVGDSVGMTSQVFLPGILAEEERTGVPKRGAKRLLFATGVAAGLVAATLAGLLPSKGAGLFTTDSNVAAALATTAPILALSVSMHAIALTCEGMLLAQRDLSFLSRSYVSTTVATIAFLLSPFRPSNLQAAWWILALFQGGRALQFSLRTLWISQMTTSRLKHDAA